MLDVRTLGPLEVFSGGHAISTRRYRELGMFVYLACEPGKKITRADLAEMFWPVSSARDALHSLSQAFYRLNGILGQVPFVAAANLVSVLPSSVSIDVADFRRAMAARRYEEALRLYGGPFLQGYALPCAPDFESWLESKRAEVAVLAEEMYRALLSEAESSGKWEEAEHAAKELLALNPYDENALATGVSLLLSRGAHSAAARLYSSAVRERPGRDEISPRLIDVGRLLEKAEEPTDVWHPTLPLIGRRTEYGAIKSQLARAQAGEGGGVLIRSRAGLGKTRLCEHVGRLASLRGFRTITATGAPLLADTPYAVARSLLASVTQEELRSIEAPWREVLTALLPGPALDKKPASPVSKEWLHEAVWQVLQRLASERPLLVVVEDLQWVDRATLEMIQVLERRCRRVRSLILASERTEEGPLDGPNLHGFRVVELHELAPDDVDHLIRAYGNYVGREIPAVEAERVRSGAGGHPLFLLELLRRWHRSAGAGARSTEVTPAASIHDFIRERFASVSLHSTRIAQALAVLGGRGEFRDACWIAGVTEEQGLAAVEELGQRGFLRNAQVLEFSHELMRAAAYDSLAGPVKAAFHTRAARALMRRPGVDVCSLALHSDLGGSHQMAYRYACIAAKSTESRFGPGEAEQYWRRAVTHARTPGAFMRSQMGLADCLYRQGSTHEADRAYEILLQSRTLPEESRILARAGRLGIRGRLGTVGDADRACSSLLADAAQSCGSGARVRVAEIVAFVLTAGNYTATLERLFPALVAAADAAPESAENVQVFERLAQVAAFCGRDRDADHFFARAAGIARTAGVMDRARVHGVAASIDFLRGHPRAAENNFMLAESLLGGQRNRLPIADLANWAVLSIELNKFALAERDLLGALEQARRNGAQYNVHLCEANLALLEFERGNADAARSYCTLCLADVGAKLPSVAVLALGVSGLLALDADKAATATTVRELRDRFEDLQPLGADFSYAEIFLARMSEREGRLGEALERIERAAGMYAGRDFFCHARLELERARLVGVSDPQAGLAIAREVRGRAVEAEAVLLLNKSEALMRELKRRSASSRRARPEAEDRGVGTRAERSRR